MKVRAKNIFTTVRSEGAILPTDLLQRIVDNDKELKGLTPAAYHLLEGEKLNEAINRSWSRLRGAWASFQGVLETLPATDLAMKVTRDRILLPLFQELGYGRLTTSRAVEIEGKAYPISHLWQNTPIHLVGYRVDLDKRTAGVAGASRSSPHSLVQEFLNRSDSHLWAFVSNGRRLRILRDNASLTRQAYVEFDLEAMMAGEVYADFVLLWLLCHQSRVEAEKPEQCWLEVWSKSANDQGKRALADLRQGVEEAIEALGQGFLTHPANRSLRRKLQSGELATQDYYRQLLRLVYRLLFLFVAEDRELLLAPHAEPAAKDRYILYYSTARLRTLAEKRRGTRHSDLFHGLRLVMEKLGSDQGCLALALPALGSFLWSTEAVADLLGDESCQIANTDLLSAISNLAFLTDKHGPRPVDYKNLQSEELGSVYESLLELHPELNISTGTFSLKTASGNERKTTGSYYTPESLVQCLLDSALDPVIEDTIQRAISEIANSEIGSGKAKNTARGGQVSGSVVSRSEGLARRNEAGRTVLPADPELPQGRDLRNDLPDSKSGSINSSKHRRGMGAGESQGVHSVPQNSSGISEGAGNSSDTGNEGTSNQSRVSGSTSSPEPGSRQDAPGLDSLHSDESQVASDYTTTPYSATHYSPTSPVEEALLNLKICDPACGSGHFLIAAAHRLAKRLAFVRTGDEEPAPEATQTALRDVIGRCIYGVDVNPMAVELCKVALWMEALEPGKPLSFLDHHIQCGNSLLGATPALLRQGIPDEAFKPIEGDDSAYCTKYKKQNKEERKGQLSLLTPDLQPWERLGDLATSMAQLDNISDDDYAGVQRKRQQYEAMVQSTPYLYSRFWADAWCAAFVWKKTSEFPYPITEEVFRRIERNPHSVDKWMRDEVERLRDQYQFFHWHLAFPDVFQVGNGESEVESRKSEKAESLASGWEGGFSVVLGNPPWDKLQPEAPKFFSHHYPEIANAGSGAIRDKLIKKLEVNDPSFHQSWLEYRRHIAGISHTLKSSKFLFNSSIGNINLYRSFGELASLLMSAKGAAGIIVQSGFVTDSSASNLLINLVNKNKLKRVFDFENKKKFFPEVHAQFRFSLVTLYGESSNTYQSAEFGWLLHSLEEIKNPERLIRLERKDFFLFGSDKPTVPILRSQKELEIARNIYRNSSPLGKTTSSKLCICFLGEMFNMNRDSKLFYSEKDCQNPENNLPLYEAKYIHQFDHRFASFCDGLISDVESIRKKDPGFYIQPKSFVSTGEINRRLQNNSIRDHWLLGFRDVSSATNERTTICAIIPRAAVGHNINLAYGLTAKDASCVLANCNCFSFDFSCRHKVAGMHVTISILKSLPIIGLENYLLPCNWHKEKNYYEWFFSLVLELTYTAWDLQPFAQDCGYEGPPFKWDEDRRFLLRCELDAAYFHLYGIQRDDVDYIMDTFPIVKRKDEKAHGHYRTKDTILQIYDAIATAIDSGQPYQTLLDPPPADLRVAHPPKASL